MDHNVPRAYSAPRVGFFDCTGQSDLTDHGIRRAYRRIALAKHPDKLRREHPSIVPAEADPPEERSAGAETIEDFTELRDSWLQDPLRFHIYRAVFDRDEGRLTEFGDVAARQENPRASASAVLQTLRARVQRVRDPTPSRHVGNDNDTEATAPRNTSTSATGEENDPASAQAAAAQRQGQDTQTDWPYLDVEIDVLNTGAPKEGFLPRGGSWTFAFARKGVSTVHYRGDEKAGGYDVCCDFLKDSKCVRKTRVQRKQEADDKLGSTDPPGPRGTQLQESSPNATSLYQTSDCPFARDQETLTFRVRKPLHKDLGGRWGGAVQIFNERREEVLCVALALEAARPEDGELASSSGGGRGSRGPSSEKSGSGQQDGHQDGSQTAGAPPSGGRSSGEQSGQPPRFHFLEAGSFCEDGADILEGPLDGYGGGYGPAAGGHFAGDSFSDLYGEKCRAKCLQRPRCRFYTAYSSGWCQLSTRCSRRKKTGDPLTVTFAKEVAPRSASTEEL